MSMKILTFTDTHGDGANLERLRTKALKADLLICAGDLTIFGNEQKQLLDFLDSFNKPVIMLHGNHEDPASLERMCNKTRNIKYAHNEAIEINDIMIVIHGGGGFANRYNDFEAIMPELVDLVKSQPKSIAVFHAPPFNTKLDDIDHNNHVGSESYRDFIDKAQPNFCICGHLHETFGKEDMVGKTKVINPGPEGKIISL